MDFEEFGENLMEDLRDQIYQRTGNDCTVEYHSFRYHPGMICFKNIPMRKRVLHDF